MFDETEFIKEFREATLDYPETNDLLEDYEFSEEAIKLGIKRALTRIRSIPPVIRSLNIELSDFDNEDKRMFLLDGVMAYVYEAKSLQEKRNEISIQEEGTVIQDDHRFSDYMQVSARKMQIFENDIKNAKSNLNEELGFGCCISLDRFFYYLGV